jgi:hypothetical protein
MEGKCMRKRKKNISKINLRYSVGSNWYLSSPLHVESQCMTASFHEEGPWANGTSLTPPLCIEMSVPSQESEWLFICVLVVYIFSDSVVCFVFLFIISTICSYIVTTSLGQSDIPDSNNRVL